MKKARIALAVGTLLTASVACSFIHPWGNVRSAKSDVPLMEGATVPADVQAVLQNKCADCHSDNTRWPAWGYFAPGSWLMERDVHEAREHLDMSRWASFDQDTKAELLSKIGSEARSGEMPPKQYVLIHRSANLTPDEQELIYAWAKAERKRLRQQAAATDNGDSEKQKEAETR
jgi:cytochrome c